MVGSRFHVLALLPLALLTLPGASAAEVTACVDDGGVDVRWEPHGMPCHPHADAAATVGSCAEAGVQVEVLGLDPAGCVDLADLPASLAAILRIDLYCSEETTSARAFVMDSTSTPCLRFPVGPRDR